MWRCSHCDESVDDTFNVCGNCGASVDGTPSPDFKPEPDATAVPDPIKDADVGAHPDPVDAPLQVRGSGGMSRPEFAALICKTLALIMFAVATVLSVTVIDLFFSILLATRYGPPDVGEWYLFLVAAVPVLAMVGMGVVYWKKSTWIALQMVPDDPRPIAFPPFTIQDAMIVAFSTTGLYFFLEGVRETARVVYIVQTYSKDDSLLAFEIWPPIIQLTLSLWLILGSRGIVSAIHWCRTAGMPQPDDGEEDENAQ